MCSNSTTNLYHTCYMFKLTDKLVSHVLYAQTHRQTCITCVIYQTQRQTCTTHVICSNSPTNLYHTCYMFKLTDKLVPHVLFAQTHRQTCTTRVICSNSPTNLYHMCYIPNSTTNLYHTCYMLKLNDKLVPHVLYAQTHRLTCTTCGICSNSPTNFYHTCYMFKLNDKLVSHVLYV